MQKRSSLKTKAIINPEEIRKNSKEIRPQEALFTLHYDKQVVGFCMCKPNDDLDAPLGKGEMHAAYILPEYRGGIVGPLMMLKMALYMKENDLSPPILWAFKQNSIRFWYAQLGWERFIYRTRSINGNAIPEYGYIHNDIDRLISRLEHIIARYLPS